MDEELENGFQESEDFTQWFENQAELNLMENE